MKKNNIITLSLLALLLAVSLPKVNAQILILDEEEFYNSNRNGSNPQDLPDLPFLGLNVDQYDYAPLDGGILLLGCLGGAYLLGKKKGRREE